MVAGYGSWARTAVNPAAKVVAAMKKQSPDHYKLHALEVPVDSEALYATLDNALQEYTPDIWIGVGVAVGSPAVRLEAIGINVRCFEVPDNRGSKLEPTPVVEGGPVAYESNLQHALIVEKLRSAGIPAVVSFHAGTHLCNQMLYSVLDLCSRHRLNLLGGFVHVPQSTDNAAISSGHDAISSSMSIPMMTQAVEATVECALRQFSQLPHSAG